MHALESSRLALVEAIDELVPRRTVVHELHDVRKQIEEQAISFRRLNTEVFPETIKKSMSESMGPTMDRMVGCLEDLNKLMRAAEATKQESISGSLEGVLRDLQTSMSKSLADMGTQFRESISGDAMQHFDQVGRSLAGTATLLEGMKAQFEGNQESLARLSKQAEEHTERQMALGRNQVEELTDVLRSLMTQLQESTGTSVAHMNTALAAVVTELSEKVTHLGNTMAASVEQSAGRATEAASTVVEQARTLSERNATQLTAILEKHSTQLDRTDELRRLLDTTIVSMREGMKDYGAASGDLVKASQQTMTLVSQFDGVVGRLASTQESIARSAQNLHTQTEGMQNATAQQEQLWQQIDRTMNQYESTFARVEKQAEQLLAQINAHLHGYTESTREGYEKLLKVADEHFSNAVQKLGSAVGELDDVLSELSDTLGKLKDSGR